VEPRSQAGSLKGTAAPLLGPGRAKGSFVLGQARQQDQKHPSTFCLVLLERWEFSAALGKAGSLTELLAMQIAFRIPLFLYLPLEDLACYTQICMPFYLLK